MHHRSVAALACLTSVLAVPALPSQSPVHRGGGLGERAAAPCIDPHQLAAIRAKLQAHARTKGFAPSAARDPLPFVPQAGNLWEDVTVKNYVDLDPTGGLLDFDCTTRTYDTHAGHDLHLRSFDEQLLGVPVVAALDGVVADAHDGEPDMNTVALGQPSNYVILWHGGTHYTWYLHLAQGSVAVAVGARVVAGQQLGLTASSGNSSWPHLHFEALDGSSAYEPYTGACNAVGSGWVQQPPLPRQPLCTDLNPNDIAWWSWPTGLPVRYPAKGVFALGWVPLGFVALFHNVPANGTARFRYLRPNGTVAADTGDFGLGNALPLWFDWNWFYTWVDHDQTGTWTIEFSLQGSVVARAPYLVASNPAAVANRPPSPLDAIAFDPAVPEAGEALFCRVTHGIADDPDYDVVRYRYQWKINGQTVRTATTAGHADVLPSWLTTAGDLVECTVTPSDGALDGPSRSVSANVAAMPCLDLSMRGAGHADGSGVPMTLSARTVSFAAQPGAIAVMLITLAPCGPGIPLPQPGCSLAPWILYPEIFTQPHLAVPGAALTIPTNVEGSLCIQGLQLFSSPGLCFSATHGYRLVIRC